MDLKKAIQVKDLLEIIDVEIIGNDESMISGINEIHKVRVGDLTFVDHPKYYEKVLESEASIILINSKEVENPHKKTLLFSKDPFVDYNKLVVHYRPKYQPSIAIESTQIDSSSQIYPNCFIGPDVKIGKNCIIHPNVSIYNKVEIGDNVIIHSNTTIGSDAFYFQKREDGYHKLEPCGSVIIMDDVELGSGCTIDRGVSGATIIGTGSKLDNQIHVGHGCVLGERCLIAAQVGIAGKTRIGNDVTIWGQAGLNKDLDIGDGVTILAKTGVGKSLKAGKTVFGTPAADARTKMKEIALIKQLPAIWLKFRDM